MRQLPTIKEIQDAKTSSDLIGLMMCYRLPYARHFRNAVVLSVADELLRGSFTYPDVAAEVSKRLGVEVSEQICKRICN